MLRSEVKQVTSSRYCSASLAVKKFLWSYSDFVGVLSRPAGSRATPEMKTKTLIILNSQFYTTLLLNKRNCDLKSFVNVFDGFVIPTSSLNYLDPFPIGLLAIDFPLSLLLLNCNGKNNTI